MSFIEGIAPSEPDPEWIVEKRAKLLDAVVKGGIQDRIFAHDPKTGELRRVVDIHVDRALDNIFKADAHPTDEGRG